MEPVYVSARTALVPLLHLGLRWTIEGADRIPTQGAAILACNHVSYLDPLVLAYVADRRHRKVRFLAKRELFDKTGVGWVLQHAHQIPVARNTADAVESLAPAVAALAAGECIGVFPEGTISQDLEPMPAKTGTARLAAASGVPVTPIGVWGVHRILFKGRKARWRWGVAETVVVGDQVAVTPDEDVHDATDRVMSAIASCVARARALYPQSPKPGEDAWWVRGPESSVARPALRSQANPT